MYNQWQSAGFSPHFYRYFQAKNVIPIIPLSKATSIISPRLTVLVNTTDENSELNSSPYSWVFPLSFSPPLIGVGIGGGKSKHSYLNAKARFTLTKIKKSSRPKNQRIQSNPRMQSHQISRIRWRPRNPRRRSRSPSGPPLRAPTLPGRRGHR